MNLPSPGLDGASGPRVGCLPQRFQAFLWTQVATENHPIDPFTSELRALIMSQSLALAQSSSTSLLGSRHLPGLQPLSLGFLCQPHISLALAPFSSLPPLIFLEPTIF